MSAAVSDAADRNAVFSGQARPMAPAASSGAAMAQLMAPDKADRRVPVMTMTPWPVVTWPNQFFSELFK